MTNYKSDKKIELSNLDTFTQVKYDAILSDRITGMSSHESWGRWSEYHVVKFDFVESLPSSLTINFNGITFWPNDGSMLMLALLQKLKA